MKCNVCVGQGCPACRPQGIQPLVEGTTPKNSTFEPDCENVPVRKGYKPGQITMTNESYTYWSAGEMRILKNMRATGMPYHDMAAALGRSVGAVRSRLYYLDIAGLATVSDPDATLISIKKKQKEKDLKLPEKKRGSQVTITPKR